MPSARPLVLIADDDEDIRELVAFRLARSGYEVVAASDGEEALSLAAKSTPDLVVLDVSMPEIGGLEVMRALRAAPATAKTPILLLTSRAQDADVENGLAAGADDYVVKPFSPEDLAHRVASLLHIAFAASLPAAGLRAVALR